MPPEAAAKPLWKRILQFPLTALIVGFGTVVLAQSLAAAVSLLAGTPLNEVNADPAFWVVSTALVVLAYKLVIARLGEQPRDDLPFDRRMRDLPIGFAEGIGRPVVVTARRDTPLPFDIADIPVVFWSGQNELQDRLRRRVKEIASTLGRGAVG